VKNTFKSYAVAHNVFRRQRARTHLQVVIDQRVTEHDLPAAGDG